MNNDLTPALKLRKQLVRNKESSLSYRPGKKNPSKTPSKFDTLGCINLCFIWLYQSVYYLSTFQVEVWLKNESNLLSQQFRQLPDVDHGAVLIVEGLDIQSQDGHVQSSTAQALGLQHLFTTITLCLVINVLCSQNNSRFIKHTCVLYVQTLILFCWSS